MRKAAELSCTLTLWWKQRLCTCQAALNLSPWRHLPYPATEAKERKLVRDIMGTKEKWSGDRALLISALLIALTWGCAKHVGKKESHQSTGRAWSVPCTALMAAHACRYMKLVSLRCCIFLAQFPEEMRRVHLCCVYVGVHERVPLSPQASLEILNPLAPFNLTEHWW